MFDSLKKRLKEALNKATSIVTKKIDEEKPAEQQIEEIQEKTDEKAVAEKEVLVTKHEDEKPPITEGKEEIPEKTLIIQKKDKKEDKIELGEEKTAIVEEELKEEIKREVEEKTKEKKSTLGRLFRRVAEKKLGENDIEPVLKELNKALLENDVALETAESICTDVRANLVGKDVSRGRVEDAIKDALRLAMLDVMKQERVDMNQEIEKKWNESKKQNPPMKHATNAEVLWSSKKGGLENFWPVRNFLSAKIPDLWLRNSISNALDAKKGSLFRKKPEKEKYFTDVPIIRIVNSRYGIAR